MDSKRLDEIAGGFAEPEARPGPLFRPEALEAAAATGFGKPVALYPMPWVFLLVGLLAMVGIFAAFLVAGNYSRKETVTGIVRTVGGEVKVVAPSPGTVSDVHVSEGQQVRAGDPILTVTTVRTGIDGRPLDAAALISIDGDIANLEARLAALDAAAGIEQRGRGSRLATLNSERASAESVESWGRERLALAEAALAKMEPLAAKGYISGESMRRRNEEILGLRQSIAESQARQSAIHGQIGDLQAVRDRQPFTLYEAKGQLLDLLGRAKRERETYLAGRGYIIKAAASGVVTALQASKGQSIDPQRTLMTISAPRAAAVAEVYVPSRAVGFLEPGQKVRVRYEAFPFQRFGSAQGTVKAISASVLRPEEVQAAVDIKEPVYRVLVTLEKDTVSAYGREYRVQAGFALTADIIQENRSFAAWLLDPLLSLKGRM